MNYNRCGFFVLALFFSVASSSVIERSKFEEGLLKLIEKWRTGDVRSLPFPLPALPLKVPFMELDIDGYTFKISKAKIKGLENMSVNKLTASESAQKLYLDISIPTAVVYADRYHLQGWLINNVGKLRATVNDLKVTADVQFGSKGANTVIKHLNFDFSVGDVKVDLSGSWAMVNKIVNNKVWGLIKQKNWHLMNRLRKTITHTANIYLRGHTPAEFIQIISSF